MGDEISADRMGDEISDQMYLMGYPEELRKVGLALRSGFEMGTVRLVTVLSFMDRADGYMHHLNHKEMIQEQMVHMEEDEHYDYCRELEISYKERGRHARRVKETHKSF